MTSDNPLETIVLEPETRPEAAVIMLHGLGADGHDLATLADELQAGIRPSIRWLFPHAPLRRVTVNAGLRTRAWYDVASTNLRQVEDETSIRASAAAIGALIGEQAADGIPAGRVVLAGFSLGGAMSLFTGLRWPERLAGIAALSCYLPLASTLSAEAAPGAAATPVFMAHGTEDPIVPFTLGQESARLLGAWGCVPAWHAYPMPHSISAEEVDDLRAWLGGVLPGA
jgi:phospholipase/carboxylesterase